MENFITIFIILLIAFVSIAKKIVFKRPAKKDGDPSVGMGWVSKLNAFINDIQQKIEAQQLQDSPTDANQWQALMEEDAPSRRYRSTLDDLIIKDESDIDDHPEKSTLKKQPDTRPSPSPAPPASPFIRPTAVRGDLGTPLQGPTVGGANLRRAVIWSEILGPPVALKDKVGGGWFK